MLLVELSCSTALTPAYNRALFDKVAPSGGGLAVFVVCGGFKITLEEMDEYRQLVLEDLARNSSSGQTVIVDDGEIITVPRAGF